ncbi:MAG: basic membrane lipoprotein [Spirochaetes bacterium]|nr:MAG: basic membrane lipoprotein [Spirochaetota bacterium]
MKRTLLVVLALLVVFGSAFAAPKSKVKIALIVESTVDDKGWCQAMHDAILAVQKKYGASLVEYNYSEKMKPVDAGSAARQYVAKGFDIVIGHGAQYKNLILEMAEEYPKTTFAFGTSGEIGPKNVFTYMPESEETGYINGVIAGLVTKANITWV